MYDRSTSSNQPLSSCFMINICSGATSWQGKAIIVEGGGERRYKTGQQGGGGSGFGGHTKSTKGLSFHHSCLFCS